MTDINTAIAKFKGFRVKTDKRGNGVTSEIYFEDSFCGYVWGVKTIDEIIKENPEIVPDFEHDARLYMALADDMPVEMSLVNFEDETTGQKFWQCSVVDLVHQSVTICEKSDTIGSAICQAWCAWKGIEVEG